MAGVMSIPEVADDRASAFEALFRAEYHRVRAIAARTGLDLAQAEDVAQEVFAQFLRRHRADAPFAAAWVRRAAAHLALNAIRAQTRRGRRELRDSIASRSHDDAAAANSTPDRIIEAEEERREVRAVMSRLSTRHAAVLALRYSGMSYAEVAAAVGIPPAHVGTLLRRAEIAFKKEYDHGASR